MDIVGGATASLCEVLKHAVTTDPDGGQRVNLLFDYETDGIRVEAPYPSGQLRITPKHPVPLSVRIPSWVDRSALQVTGTETEQHYEEDYLVFDSPNVAVPNSHDPRALAW
jgi:hypothetical protein